MDFERRDLFGVPYAIVDYGSATQLILDHARRHDSFSVSALAVHGLVTAVRDPGFGERVRRIDLVVPDGQPVRWALNAFHRAGLRDRVYGPALTLHVLKSADADGLGVFLYGSTAATLEKLAAFIRRDYPGVRLCGLHPDRFREPTDAEDEEDVRRIRDSGAHIVLVGRGCPRQEAWVADHRGRVPAAMLAVGAAFDFHAGTLAQAPAWMQRAGLEWLYRLLREPRRLWKRYLTTNSYFIYLCLRRALRAGRKP